ncbi:MAG: substrate-binding domain-containing protein [Planctomycetota bacterium]
MHIAIGIARAQSFGQQVLEGILARTERLSWTVMPQLRGPLRCEDLGPPGRIQGAISLVPDDACLRLIRRRRLPLVLVQASDQDIPQVIPDDRALGRLAAEHLLQRGFRRLAVCPWVPARFASDRAEGFIATAASTTTCQIHDGRLEAEVGFYDRQVLRRWLRRLPRGTAIMATLIGQALDCLNLLQELGRRVPEDIALICAEEDADIAAMGRPQITTVHFNGHGIGLAAMAMLERLLDGRPLRARIQRGSPLGVIQRGSCDLWASDDPLLLRAVSVIADGHAQLGFCVGDVVAILGCSRRSLEQRFRDGLGRGVADEIRRCRLDQAARLLRDTDRLLLDVALACGWSSASQLCRRFKRHYGCTPQQWRLRG